MKRTLSLLAVLVLMLTLLTGCGNKAFSCQNLSMQVPSYMTDVSDNEDYADYTFVLDSAKFAILGLKDDLEVINYFGVNDLEGYAQLMCQLYELDTTVLQRKDYTYITYDEEIDGDAYRYLAGMFYDGNDYWLIQIACLLDNYNSDELLGILDSVSFS